MCSDEFHALGKSEAEILGMPGLPLVIIPHPMAKRRPDEVAEVAANAVDEVIAVWTGDPGELAETYKARVPEQVGRLHYHSLFEGNFNAPDAPESFKSPDSLEAINTLMYRRGWTDGLPIVPPTEERWRAMLGDWDKDTLLGLVEPKLGRATVGKVAANAVMAGCQPEHFPVLCAAVRAICEKPLNLKALQTTTHPCTVMLMVSGPIAEEIGVNATYNLMGQGRLANAALGRALRFVLLNIGGAAPGVLDRATQGTPAKFSFCWAENPADNPWTPISVQRGFDPGRSTVTVAGVEGPHNVNDHYGRTAEEVLLTVAGTCATTGSNNCYLGGEIFIVLGPEHAETIARDGWSLEQVKQFLMERAIVPGWHISEAQGQAIVERSGGRFVGRDWTEGSYIFRSPEEIVLTVAGGAGRHSCIMPSFGNTRSVTVPVTDAKGEAL
jgi:hypothetical protein